MRVIAKDEYVPTEEDREEDPNYKPLLTIEEQTEPVILELNEPIEVSGETVNEVTINPPRGRHVFKNRTRNKKGEQNPLLTEEFLAKSCNIPVSAFDEMLLKDINRIGDIITAFTRQTPKVHD